MTEITVKTLKCLSSFLPLQWWCISGEQAQTQIAKIRYLVAAWPGWLAAFTLLPWQVFWNLPTLIRMKRESMCALKGLATGEEAEDTCPSPRSSEPQTQRKKLSSAFLRPMTVMAEDTLAERLRRRPAKPMGSPRVGSNPTGVVSCAASACSVSWILTKANQTTSRSHTVCTS